MWEPNHCSGTGHPCKAISKLCLGRKRGHQIACSQLMCASTLEQPVPGGTCRYNIQHMVLAGHYSGTKGTCFHGCSLCWEKQGCGSNFTWERIYTTCHYRHQLTLWAKKGQVGDGTSLFCAAGGAISDTAVLLRASEPLSHPCWVERLIPE